MAKLLVFAFLASFVAGVCDKAFWASARRVFAAPLPSGGLGIVFSLWWRVVRLALWVVVCGVRVLAHLVRLGVGRARAAWAEWRQRRDAEGEVEW